MVSEQRNRVPVDQEHSTLLAKFYSVTKFYAGFRVGVGGHSHQHFYPAVNPVSYNDERPGKIFPLMQQWSEHYEVTKHFLIF